MVVGAWQVVIVVLVVAVLFGPRLGRLGKSLGRGARHLKRTLRSAGSAKGNNGSEGTPPDWVTGVAHVARAANSVRKGVKLGRIIR
jgi:TatA/E family protein of Tat protein translocase